jgi:3-oxoacyl-[acyl-carrier-protein] synthase II/nodulation protein E
VSQYAASAALLALQHAGAEPLGTNAGRSALVGGTMFGGLEACLTFNEQLVQGGPDLVNPSEFPNTAHNMACAQAAIRLGIQGPVYTLCSGLAAGLDAILWGCRALRAGRAELVLAGGFDRWVDTLGAGLQAMGVPLASGPKEPGLRPSEGACFVVLEPEERCRARGARPLARVLGFGQSSGDGALLNAMRNTIRMAGGAAPTVACVGTQGLARTDAAVDRAHRELLDEGLPRPAMLHHKQILGETFGASGPFAIASALAALDLPPGPALIESLAWGGAASALLIQPFH